jgi:dephospho-CoA kinase
VLLRVRPPRWWPDADNPADTVVPVKVVGLTGGIGSGKSTVAAKLVARGAHLVDADRIVRDLQRPGEPVFDAMVERFGPGIVADDGTLDRAAVASIVFADNDALEELNAIVHPAVRAEIARQTRQYEHTDDVVVLDIPLFDRVAVTVPVAGVLVVDVPVDLQVERLVRHRGFDEADAWARIAQQRSREDRLADADYVIDNAGDEVALDAALDAAWAWIEDLPAVAA